MKTDKYLSKIPIPLWVRIVVGLMGLLTVGFSFAPASFLLPGLSTDVSVPLNAAYLFHSRNIAIGIGMLIVSVFGSPESIAVVMFIRLMLEIADRFAMAPLFSTVTIGNLLAPLIPLLIELTVIVTLLGVLWKRRTQTLSL